MITQQQQLEALKEQVREHFSKLERIPVWPTWLDSWMFHEGILWSDIDYYDWDADEEGLTGYFYCDDDEEEESWEGPRPKPGDFDYPIYYNIKMDIEMNKKIRHLLYPRDYRFMKMPFIVQLITREENGEMIKCP